MTVEIRMAKKQLKRLTPRALGIMDWMLAQPGGGYADCARELGVSKNWISIVANSRVFQIEMQRRRRALHAQIDQKAAEAACAALDGLMETLKEVEDPRLLLEAVDKLTGYCFRMESDQRVG